MKERGCVLNDAHTTKRSPVGTASGYHAFLFAKQLGWTIPHWRSIERFSRLSDADNKQMQDRTKAGCEFNNPKRDYKDYMAAGMEEEANRAWERMHCTIARSGRACIGCRPPELYPDRPPGPDYQRQKPMDPPGGSWKN